MKKILYLTIALCAVSCSAESDFQNTLYNVAASGTDMALDSLQQAANKELEKHTGVDSLATKIRSSDTIHVERAVKQELIDLLSE